MIYMPARVTRVYVEQVADNDPDLSYLQQDYEEPSIPPEEAAKYREQDRARLEAYAAGEWWCVGVRAVAEIEIPSRQGGWWRRDRITSAGIWGTESDSDAAHFTELAEDELHDLRDMLEHGYRFPADALAEAFKDAEVQP